MITQERLKELIQQKATVYINFTGLYEPKEYQFEKRDKVQSDTLNYHYKEDEYNYYAPLEIIFEIKSDAEFARDYKNIPRIETLDLPFWKDVDSKDTNTEISFTVKGTNYRLLVWKDYIAIDGNGNSQITYGDKNEFAGWDKTEQNYLKACAIAKKLFLGE